jgi:hypothetical protein
MSVRKAIETLAESESWDQRSVADLGVLLWALFRYYARRLADD